MSTVPGWLREVPIAHRGLHGDGTPENSVAAFRAAAAAGYGVELDVHVTADAELVVLHDDDTRRTTGVDRRVATTRLAELAELPLEGTTERVPALRRVLDELDGSAPVLVEVKAGTPAGVVGPLVADLLAGRRDVAVQSFDPRIVGWFARHARDVTRGQLAGRGEGLPWALRPLLRAMVGNAVVRPHFLAHDVGALADPPLRVWRALLDAPLLAWTVRDAATLRTARAAGANVIFEGVDPLSVPARDGRGRRRPPR